MHHYCTVTSTTMAQQETALHKAYLLPDRGDVYLARSAYHYSIGQRCFRGLLSDVTASNGRPVFCFATMVIAYVLCQSARPSQGLYAESEPIAGTLELFSVTKGIKAVLEPFIPQLNHTNLAPLVTSVWLTSADALPDSYISCSSLPWTSLNANPQFRKPSLKYSVLPDDVFSALSRLRRFYRDEGSLENKVDYEKAVTIHEVSAMQIAYADVNVEVGAILLWPFFLPDSIVTDMRDQRPHGLIVLAYYAVFLNCLDRTYWFSRGWGLKLLRDIDVRVKDHERLRDSLAWPRTHIDT